MGSSSASGAGAAGGSGAELYKTFMQNYKSPAVDEALAKEAAARAGQGMSAMPQLQQFQAQQPLTQATQPVNPMASYTRRYYGG